MFSFHDAAAALGVSLQRPASPIIPTGVSIDTRTLAPGDFFVALEGTRVDGHEFLDAAFARGASGALVSRTYWQRRQASDSVNALKNILPVENCAKGLWQLAARQRENFHGAVVGITGSVGKTTTKDCLAYLLGKTGPVLSTRGNFNNHLGLPLTLLRLTEREKFCVAELGANHAGEIRFLAGLLRPTAAVMTPIAPAHLEGFGSLEGVYRAKMELVESLSENSPVVYPAHDVKLRDMIARKKVRAIGVGSAQGADRKISAPSAADNRTRFRLDGRKDYAFPGSAAFLVLNAAMAVVMAEALGVREEQIPRDWTDLKLPAGRFEVVPLAGGVQVVYDGYNASPYSFRKALEAFALQPAAGRKFVVFADMLELGADAVSYHAALGRELAQYPFDFVAAYGPLSRHAIEILTRERPSGEAAHYENAESLADALFARLRPGDVILMKASRGMHVETVLEEIRKYGSGSQETSNY